MDAEDVWFSLYFHYAGVMAALVVACLLMYRFLLRRDNSAGRRMPETGELDWASIAFLRGGSDAVLEIVDFQLARKGLIGLPSYTPVERTDASNASGSLEQLRWNYYQKVWNYCKKPGPKPTPDLFKYHDLPEHMENHFEDAFEKWLATVRQKLASLYLISTEPNVERAERIRSAMIVLVVLSGGTWLVGNAPWEGSMCDKAETVIFVLLGLACYSFLAVLALWYGFTRPGYKGLYDKTELGKKYLSGLRERYEWLYKKVMEKSVPSEDDLTTVLAIFGLQDLSQAPFFKHKKDTLPAAQSTKWDRIKGPEAETYMPAASETVKPEKHQTAFSPEMNALKQRLEQTGWKKVQPGKYHGAEFDLVGSLGGFVRWPWTILVKTIPSLDNHAFADLKKAVDVASMKEAQDAVQHKDYAVYCILCETINEDVLQTISSDFFGEYCHGSYILVVDRKNKRVYGEVPSEPEDDRLIIQKVRNILIDLFSLTDKPVRDRDWLKWGVIALSVMLLIYVPFKENIERLLSPETAPKPAPVSSPTDTKQPIPSSDSATSKADSSPEPSSSKAPVPAPSSAKITAANLQTAARNFEKQYPKRFTNIALGEWLGKQTGGFTPDAVEWLQKRYGGMNGNLSRYQVSLIKYLPGARILDINSDGMLDADDLVFVSEGLGEYKVRRLGKALRDRVLSEEKAASSAR